MHMVKHLNRTQVGMRERVFPVLCSLSPLEMPLFTIAVYLSKCARHTVAMYVNSFSSFIYFKHRGV